MNTRTCIWKKALSLTMLGACALSLCACGSTHIRTLLPVQGELTSQLTEEPVIGKDADSTFCSSAADFSIRLFQTALTQCDSGENVLVSPESVLSALAMTANGAGSTTRTEMEQALCNGMSIEDFNPYMYSFRNHLNASEDVTFHEANSIWIRNQEDRISLHTDFLQTNKNYYGTDAYYSAFDDQTVKEINHWVKENTNDMIPLLLNEPISDDIVLYLINALAFEGEWDIPYEDTQITEDGIFTNYAGAEEASAMLNSTEACYIHDEHATGFIKNYKGGDFAFLALLPEEGMSPEEYAASLTGESYLKLYQHRQYRDVIVQLPEFTYDYSAELQDVLSEMGMQEAFQDTADFSNMGTTDTGYLYINRVLHKTHIEVDRNGTKAAAVTAIEITTDSCSIDTEEPVIVILNRPFVYAIIDTESGIPIFLGTVNSIQ